MLKKNKILILALTFMGLSAYVANAQTSGSCGTNLNWSFNSSTGALTITGSGDMSDYTSFSSVPWYSYRTNITSVSLPNGLTSIGDYAFDACWKLKSVTIPNSVRSIGNAAFGNCDELASITIPNSVTSIGSGAFSRSGLTSVTIPNSVTSIGSYAFDACWKLKSVTIPNSVRSIGNAAFGNCGELASITIPNSVTSIGGGAFYACHGLTGALIIPNSVTSIGYDAFGGCSGLTSVTIGNSVTSIGYDAFHLCSGLTSISVDANNPNYSSIDGVLYNKQQTTLVVYPAGKTGTVTIPNSVTSIGNYAFRDCTGLTSITIPNTVTSIGDHAFHDCSSLTGALTIPESVTSIGEWAFYDCRSLTSVTIPNTVTSIGEGAFFDCSGLTSVTIPNSVTSIGDRAFYDCSGLTSVTIPNSVTSIGSVAFYNCSGLTSVTIPNSVTSIDYYAFDGCSGLTLVVNERLTPPEIREPFFSETYNIYNNATLYVPTASLALYREAEGWKNFKNILPMEGAFANYEISLSATPAKGGTVTGSGTAQEYTNRTVTAIANTGYIFAGWRENDTIVSANAQYTFPVTGNRTLVAVFYETNIDISDIELPANKNVAIVGEDASARVACRINLNATGYNLVIYSANGADVICSLEFNAAGNLLSISFGQQTKGAEQDMFGVKINNLSENTTYYYTMQTLGEGGTVIATEEGSFKTTGAGVVGMLHATSLPEIIGYYTLTGQRLAQAPEKGIYIILYDNGKAEKVLRQ